MRHVYDKAKFHDETIEQYGLSEEHAANHTVMFLRWLIEREMMSTFFESEAVDILRQFRAGEASIHEIYEWWDNCLVSDMLSDDGNAFALHYFDFDQGRFIHDYAESLAKGLQTELHVVYTEENYKTMKQIIDRRYDEWSGTKR